MTELIKKQCVPCRGGIPPLTKAEAEVLLAEVPGWQLTPDGKSIRKEYQFGNFAEALQFVNEVGEIVEREDHHPDMTLGWGYVHVTFYTHKIGGLHENDFIVAAKIDSELGGR